MNATNTLAGLLACALTLAAATPARAQAAASAAGAAEAAAPDASDDWSGWIQTLEDSAKALRDLRKTERALQAEVDEAITRRYPRGEEKQRLLAALARAQKDLAEAEQQFPDQVEQARQAGVPQGLLQDYEELAETPASQDVEDADTW